MVSFAQHIDESSYQSLQIYEPSKSMAFIKDFLKFEIVLTHQC